MTTPDTAAVATVTRTIDTDEPDGAPRYVRYALTGSVDRALAFEMYQQVLADLLAGRRHFALDFAAAGYVDGRALQVLKQLSYKVLEVRGVLVFENVNADLYTLLELTRLTNVFEVRRAPAPDGGR